MKKIYAEYKVKQKRKADLKKFAIDTQRYDSEAPKILPNEESSDSQLISGNDDCGNQILIKFTRRRHRVAEVLLFLRLSTGQVYTLPNQPNTTIVNATPRIFEGAGLKLECLVPFNKFRITFSGILRRGVAQDVSEVGDFLYSRFNFM